MLVSMWGSTLLMPWAAVVHLQLKRVEGRFSVFSNTQYDMGVLLVAEFVFLILYWQATAFRSDRDPKIVQAFNDLVWIPFVALTSTIVQALMMSVVMLLDRSAEPVFPRWAGYFNMSATICLTPGTLDVVKPGIPSVGVADDPAFRNLAEEVVAALRAERGHASAGAP
jgi:hypothetical protein